MFRRMLVLVLALLIILPVVRVAGQDGSGNSPSDDVQAQSAPGGGIPGRVVGDLNLRTAPDVSDDTLVRTLHNNDPVEILASGPGDDGELWHTGGQTPFVHRPGAA